VIPSDFNAAELDSCTINSNPPNLHRVLSCSTDTDLHSNNNTKSLVSKEWLPSRAKEQRRSTFDWLNSPKIQRSQSVGKLSNVIGIDENVSLPRLPSGRTSGLRGLLSSVDHQLENEPLLQTKR